MRVVAVFEVKTPNDEGRMLTCIRKFVYDDPRIDGVMLYEVPDLDQSASKLDELQKRMRVIGVANND